MRHAVSISRKNVSVIGQIILDFSAKTFCRLHNKIADLPNSLVCGNYTAGCFDARSGVKRQGLLARFIFTIFSESAEMVTCNFKKLLRFHKQTTESILKNEARFLGGLLK